MGPGRYIDNNVESLVWGASCSSRTENKAGLQGPQEAAELCQLGEASRRDCLAVLTEPGSDADCECCSKQQLKMLRH